jgi:hypothetical protein
MTNGSKFNTIHYVTKILSSLLTWRLAETNEDEWKLIIHVDRNHPHTDRLSIHFFKQNRMKPTLHLSNLSNLALFDFCLFGYVKGYLTSFSFKNTDELLEAIQGVLESIEKVIFQMVFLNWMDRMKKYIIINEKYTNWVKTKIVRE